MAPEQARGDEADHRSDLYALGAVLYELLTGRRPHAADSTVALLDAKNHNIVEAPSVRAKQRGLSKMVDKTILRALDRDPDKRFQSADEMREALEAALREPEERRKTRRRMGFAALGALTIALGAGAGVGATKPDVRERARKMVQPLIERVRGQAPQQVAANVEAAAQEPAEASDDESAAAGAPPETATAAEGTAQEEPAAGSEGAEEPVAVAAADSEASKEGAADEGSQPPGADDGAVKEVAKADGSQSDKAASAAEGEGSSAEQAKVVNAEAEGGEDKGSELETKIAAAQGLMDQGRKVKGFNQLRRLGRNNQKDKRALKAWCEAAIAMRGWGEAHRVAIRWAAIDSSPEAQIQYARLQRAVGKQRHAIKTLKRLLQRRPGHEEARHMLRAWTGGKRVARR